MVTATAAIAAADRSSAALRLRELAANLSLHRGFAEVVASLEVGDSGGDQQELKWSPALAEQSFKQLVARDAKMGGNVAEDCSKCADA